MRLADGRRPTAPTRVTMCAASTSPTQPVGSRSRDYGRRACSMHLLRGRVAGWWDLRSRDRSEPYPFVIFVLPRISSVARGRQTDHGQQREIGDQHRWACNQTRSRWHSSPDQDRPAIISRGWNCARPRPEERRKLCERRMSRSGFSRLKPPTRIQPISCAGSVPSRPFRAHQARQLACKVVGRRRGTP